MKIYTTFRRSTIDNDLVLVMILNWYKQDLTTFLILSCKQRSNISLPVFLPIHTTHLRLCFWTLNIAHSPAIRNVFLDDSAIYQHSTVRKLNSALFYRVVWPETLVAQHQKRLRSWRWILGIKRTCSKHQGRKSLALFTQRLHNIAAMKTLLYKVFVYLH